MIYFFLVFIIACANNFFHLVPFYHVKGVFRVSDLGLLLIFVLIAYVIHKKKKNIKLFNNISFFILLYIFMVMLHVSIGSFNYGQSVLDGLIKIRHQFYYLLYFVFLFVFAEEKNVEKFFKILSVVALVILLLSLINYFGIILFYHEKWAEGHGVRAGIKRAFIPAMNILGVVFVWHFTRFIQQNRLRSINGLYSIIMYFGIFFRQTRGRILAATASALWVLFRERRLKMLTISLMIVSITAFFSIFFFQESFLSESFRTAYSDITKEEGTWDARMDTTKHALQTFKEHPLLGSGALVLRQTDDQRVSSSFKIDAYQGDLGYVHFLKNFGLLGATWMIALFIVVYLRIIKVRRYRPDGYHIAFCEYQLVHMAISNVTIDYFSRIDGIVILTMTLALASTAHTQSDT